MHFKYNLFLSYASENKDIADYIVDRIEKRGYKCFIAPRDIRTGAEYAGDRLQRNDRRNEKRRHACRRRKDQTELAPLRKTADHLFQGFSYACFLLRRFRGRAFRNHFKNERIYAE